MTETLEKMGIRLLSECELPFSVLAVSFAITPIQKELSAVLGCVPFPLSVSLTFHKRADQ